MADTRVPRSSSPSPASTPVNTAVHASGSSSWLTPERVAHAEFRSSFRGLDGTEVRSFLARVAAELRGLLERETELLSRVEAAEERQVVTAAEPLDVQQVSDLLGQETARVLSLAREAAADIKTRAEAEAAALTAVAVTESERLRTESEGLVGDRRAEAEAAAAEILSRAEAAAEELRAESIAEAERVREEADTYARGVRGDADKAAEELRATAKSEAEVLRAEASAAAAKLRAETAASAEAALSRAKESAAVISAAAEARRDELVSAAVAERDAAREDGKRMVGEARAVRERILGDMARRRNASRQQLERVRAARERLLDSIEGVRQGVADVQAELAGSLVEAKLAGDRAARGVDVNEVPSLRELEAEVRLARDTGLIDDQSVHAASADPVGGDAGEAVEVGEVGEVGEVVGAETAEDVSDGADLGDADTGDANTGDANANTGEVRNDSDRHNDGHNDNDVNHGESASLDAEESGPRPMLRSVPASGIPVDPAAGAGRGRIQVSPFNGGDRAVVRMSTEGSDPEPVPVWEPAISDAPGEGTVIDLREHTDGPSSDHGDGGVHSNVPDGGASPSLDVIDAVLESGSSSTAALDPNGSDDGVGGGDHETGAVPGGAGGPGGDGIGSDVAARSTGSGGSPAGRSGPVVPRRGTRRERSGRRTEDLFARLRAADESAASGTRNGSGGVGALVGLATEPSMVMPSDPIEEVTVLAVVPAAHEPADASDPATEPTAGDVEEPVELDPDRVALHTRDAVLAGPLRDLSRQLKLTLSDQQNEMLQAQRNPDLKRVLVGEDAAVAPTFGEIASALEEACAGELMVAWSLGRRSVREDDEVQAGPEEVAGEVSALARRIVSLLQDRLGEPEEDTGAWDVDRVRAAYREVRSQRLAELVEFNLYSAYAAGQLASADAGSRARWVSDACGPDCLDNALAGDVIFGEAFPTGHLAPPSFPGCRCCLVRAD